MEEFEISYFGEGRAARHDQAAARKRTELEDLALVLARQEGREVLRRILARTGVGSWQRPEAEAVHNLGLELLRQISQADPRAGAEIILALYQMPAGSQPLAQESRAAE